MPCSQHDKLSQTPARHKPASEAYGRYAHRRGLSRRQRNGEIEFRGCHRLERDVGNSGFSDLEASHVHGQNDVRPDCGVSSAAPILPLRWAVAVGLSGQNFLASRSVSVQGVRATDVSRELARYRSLPSCASDHALLPRHSRRCGAKHARLADAIDPCDWRIYRDFANPLIETARELDVNDEFGVDLANTVDALETTTIDPRGNIPSFVHVSDNKTHEVNGLDILPPEPAALPSWFAAFSISPPRA
jgi:hypothetical protein